MVQYTLWIKATLENVESFQWADSKDSDSSSRCTLLCLTIRNPTDPETVREKIVVDFSELEPQKPTSSRSTADPDHPHPPSSNSNNNNGSSSATTAKTGSRQKPKHPTGSSNSSSYSSSKHNHHAEKPHHFHVTWSGDHSKGTIRVVQVNHYYTDPDDNSQVPYPLQSDEWYPVLTLECENVEPVQFHPLGNEFVVSNRNGGGSGTAMVVDLSSEQEDGASLSWVTHEWSTGTTAVRNLVTKFE